MVMEFFVGHGEFVFFFSWLDMEFFVGHGIFLLMLDMGFLA